MPNLSRLSGCSHSLLQMRRALAALLHLNRPLMNWWMFFFVINYHFYFINIYKRDIFKYNIHNTSTFYIFFGIFYIYIEHALLLYYTISYMSNFFDLDNFILVYVMKIKSCSSYVKFKIISITL